MHTATIFDLANFMDEILRDTHKVAYTPWDAVPSFPPAAVDVNDAGDIRFRFALAGVDKDSVDVSFQDNRLYLEIKPQEKKDDGWRTIRSRIKESVQGKVWYSIPLSKYDANKAQASWKDGILLITVPIKPESKPVKVKIS